MAFPIEVVFKCTDHSDNVEALAREKFEALAKYCPTIENCRVVVELPMRRRADKGLAMVRAYLKIPGQEIVVNDQETFTDLKEAIGTTFDAARRQLEDHVRRSRHCVKAHSLTS